MKSTRMKRSVALATVSALALVTAACSGSGSSGDAGSSDGQVTIRVGYQPDLDDLTYYAAVSEGIFDKNNIKVKAVKFQSGPAEFAAISSGSIDVAILGAPPASIGLSQGIDGSVIALGAQTRTAEGLVARKGSGIKTLKDLKGKKIATVRGSSGEFALQTALSKVGLDNSDIDQLELDVNALIPAFKRGDVDAGYFWQPWLSLMEEAGGEVIVTDAEIGITMGTVWIARNDWIKSDSEAVKRFVKSMDEAAKAIKTKPESIARDAAKQMGFDAKLAETIVVEQQSVYPTVKEQLAPDYELSMAPESIKKGTGLAGVFRDLGEFYKEKGTVKEIPDYTEYINPDFLQPVLKQTGE